MSQPLGSSPACLLALVVTVDLSLGCQPTGSAAQALPGAAPRLSTAETPREALSHDLERAAELSAAEQSEVWNHLGLALRAFGRPTGRGAA